MDRKTIAKNLRDLAMLLTAGAPEPSRIARRAIDLSDQLAKFDKSLPSDDPLRDFVRPASLNIGNLNPAQRVYAIRIAVESAASINEKDPVVNVSWRDLLNTPPSHGDLAATLNDLADKLSCDVAFEANSGKCSSINREAPQSPQHDKFVANRFQQDILSVLNLRALETKPLADAVCGGDTSRLYKRGGLKELRKENLVLHKPRLGFYRPDAPPLEGPAVK